MQHEFKSRCGWLAAADRIAKMKPWQAMAAGVPLALLIIAGVFILAFLFTGCAQMFTAKTEAVYIVHPDGTKEIRYSSDKEQVGLEASFGDVKVKVDKSGTQESVIAAVAEQQKAIAEILKTLVPLATKAAGVP